jgi:hypothetical protein
MANGVNPKEPMALVKITYSESILLNADDAYALFKLLCKAEVLEYSWSDSTYKRKKIDANGAASLHAFSPVDYAALSLNSTD